MSQDRIPTTVSPVKTKDALESRKSETLAEISKIKEEMAQLTKSFQ